MKRITAIIIILIMFSGCRTKKEYIHTTSTDTIYKKEIVKITPSSLNELIIDNPCDSLGNLKPFEYKINSPKVKTTIKSIDNKVVVEQNLDSIKEVWQKEFQSSVKTVDKKVEIPVTPKWAWKSLIANILLLLWILRKPLLRLINPIK